MKKLIFMGRTREILRNFSKEARYIIGTELQTLEHGFNPPNTKNVSDIGPGAIELRVKTTNNNYRIIYIAKFSDAIYILHCFTKKSNKILKKDIRIAKSRYKDLMQQYKEA